METVPIYLMPGMGANYKIFEYLTFPDKFEVFYLNWLIPQKNEELSHYVLRIRQQIKHENPILIGVSFGGIIIQELSKYISVRQLILISTIKHQDELPPLYKIVKNFGLYQLFPFKLTKYHQALKKVAIHQKLQQKIKIYNRYFKVTDPYYIKWSVYQVLHWKQTKELKNYIHIVGEKDIVFPVKYIKDPKIIVSDGSHEMIIFKARHISNLLQNLL